MNKAPFMTALLVAVTSLTAVGCSSSSASTVFTHTNYTALGASDAMGVGSSVPCATAGIPAVPSPVSCPGGKGYVPVLAGFLTTSTNSVNLIDLGISGAVTRVGVTGIEGRGDSSPLSFADNCG